MRSKTWKRRAVCRRVGKDRMPKSPSPMPLTAFEEYMLRDDGLAHPMSIVARLRFAGRLDRHAASAALRKCHCPASAAAGRRSAPIGKRPPGMGRGRSLCRRCDGKTMRCPAVCRRYGPIDLATEPGLRAWASADACNRAASYCKCITPSATARPYCRSPTIFSAVTPARSAGSSRRVELSPCDEKLLRRARDFRPDCGEAREVCFRHNSADCSG